LPIPTFLIYVAGMRKEMLVVEDSAEGQGYHHNWTARIVWAALC
jgi:hypothetical protein